MKCFRIIVLAFFVCGISSYSQDTTIKHSIVKGETISSIAKKYNVSIADIYKINPEAKKTLHLNQIILIPNSVSNITNDAEKRKLANTTQISHQVLPKETLYGITKQFKTTTELLYKANPKLESEGLKNGQIIVIPSGLTSNEIAGLSNTNSNNEGENTSTITHQVKPKESLYAIAKQYGISLKELQEANPKIGRKGLSIGQEITIPANGKLHSSAVLVANENENIQTTAGLETKKTDSIAVDNVANKTEFVTNDVALGVPVANTVLVQDKIKATNSNKSSEIVHTVLTKETKYGIAKQYGISVADLEKQNPSIITKLEVGAKLTIHVSNLPVVEEKKIENVVQIGATEKQTDSISVPINLAMEELINKLIESASDKIGTRYRIGGTTTTGFDCSGLIYSTFGSFDIKLPRSSIEQSTVGERVDDDNAQKGDLIFFKTNGRSRINHVGMVVEVIDDEIKFIHSSTHSGVIISSTKEPYYQRTFAQVNRVLK
ncbi:C40 family peptidase [Flavobacterium adhaerens]|uniref:C40 family peptidase n=1 Tax=Flavobacterium adhaerens TaxID=3149043 RepID=UPI0032B33A44